MATTAKIIGRRGCTWCGFESAHIKQTEGKHPYHHCPECGIMTHAKNGQQAKLMTGTMRPEPNYQEQAAKAAEATGASTSGPKPPETDDPIIVRGVVSTVHKSDSRAVVKPSAPVPVTAQNWASSLLGGAH